MSTFLEAHFVPTRLWYGKIVWRIQAPELCTNTTLTQVPYTWFITETHRRKPGQISRHFYGGFFTIVSQPETTERTMHSRGITDVLTEHSGSIKNQLSSMWVLKFCSRNCHSWIEWNQTTITITPAVHSGGDVNCRTPTERAIYGCAAVIQYMWTNRHITQTITA